MEFFCEVYYTLINLIGRTSIEESPMSKAIDIHLSQLRFPSTCVVCMSPATKSHELQKGSTYRRRSYTVKVNVPMCDLHFWSASVKGPAEKWIGILGVIAGILSGLLATTLVLVHWEGIGYANILLNLLAGGILGLAIFLIVWAIISLSMASFFAEPASKEARQAVRFTRYWPEHQFVRLEFQNEQLADIVRNAY